MVHSGEPERAMSRHAVPACQDVNLRVLQHVADVNVSGDVWRRYDDAENGPVGAFLSAEQAGVHPSLRPLLLDQLRFVRFGDFFGHGNTERHNAATVNQLLYGPRAQRVNPCSPLFEVDSFREIVDSEWVVYFSS